MARRRRHSNTFRPRSTVLHHGPGSPDLYRRHSPLDHARRALIGGPDRLGALIFLFVFGCMVVIPGSLLLSLVALVLGPSTWGTGPSVYIENAAATLLLALIGMGWLELRSRRRGVVAWLRKNWRRDRL